MQDRLLLAVNTEADRRLCAALSGFDLTHIATARELRQVLAMQQFDLIVVGAHFDESNALRMIPEIRSALPGARIACVRAEPFRHVGAPAIKAVRLACEALEVQLFVDLLEYPDDAEGNRAIRELFERQLSAARV